MDTERRETGVNTDTYNITNQIKIKDQKESTYASAYGNPVSDAPLFARNFTIIFRFMLHLRETRN